jgi:hypothetical protein
MPFVYLYHCGKFHHKVTTFRKESSLLYRVFSLGEIHSNVFLTRQILIYDCPKITLVINDIHLADCRDLFGILAGSGQLILLQ